MTDAEHPGSGLGCSPGSWGWATRSGFDDVGTSELKMVCPNVIEAYLYPNRLHYRISVADGANRAYLARASAKIEAGAAAARARPVARDGPLRLCARLALWY